MDTTALSAALTATCQTAENVTVHTGRIWNKPIVAETKGEIVTVGGIGADMGHCQWLTDGLKVGPKVGARSEVWAD